ncbi:MULTISPECIES: hypothetical protein [Idiomarina]|nr:MULTISPECIES: hypothetical protein [Idiomarina]
MMTRIRDDVIAISKNYLINPLHGFERPKPPGSTLEELVEQDRQA